ncbi:glycerate kinase [Enterococcus sp.]|uniref:glycerate kinase family protein n=1 Tax=Enterococcus sp. TaxID=35783 RepID=UPI0028AB6984|nr:glycerate kinase [Enterococcus sp.]
MKVIAAIDSFKGCASSEEINQAALSGFSDKWQKINIPIADGGEGTMAAIYAAYKGQYQTVLANNPLGEEVQVNYLITEIDGERTAVIESAQVIGLHFINPSDQVARQVSSFGLGQVVLSASDQEVSKIYITLGGSATSDGGLGFLQAIGVTFFNNDRGNGNLLLDVENIDYSTLNKRLKKTALVALADVNNPYIGERGFAKIFGPQKGADQSTIDLLESQATKVVDMILNKNKININIPSAGAAGGIGGAIYSIGGQIQPGFATIASLLDFPETIKEANLILTGEGRIDGQTSGGKVPYGVAILAKNHHIPTIALCGTKEINVDEIDAIFTAVFSIQSGPISLSDAMEKDMALKNVQSTSSQICRMIERFNS